MAHHVPISNVMLKMLIGALTLEKERVKKIHFGRDHMGQEKVMTKVALAKKLCISRSSLYYKPKKPPSDEKLKTRIVTVMDEHSSYSHRRIATLSA